jgi:hypothetical protein
VAAATSIVDYPVQLTAVVRRHGVARGGRARAGARHDDLLLDVARHEVDRLDRLRVGAARRGNGGHGARSEA